MVENAAIEDGWMGSANLYANVYLYLGGLHTRLKCRVYVHNEQKSPQVKIAFNGGHYHNGPRGKGCSRELLQPCVDLVLLTT